MKLSSTTGLRCLACNHERKGSTGYQVFIPEGKKTERKAGRRRASKTSCIHGECLTPGLAAWLDEYRFRRNGVIQLPNLAKFREIRKSRKLNSLIGSVGVKPNLQTKFRYDDETNKAFYGSREWTDIAAPATRKLFGWRCCRCGRKTSNQMPVHHLHGILSDTRPVRFVLVGARWKLEGELAPACDQYGCHKFIHDNVPSWKTESYFKAILLRFAMIHPWASWSRELEKILRAAPVTSLEPLMKKFLLVAEKWREMHPVAEKDRRVKTADPEFDDYVPKRKSDRIADDDL